MVCSGRRGDKRSMAQSRSRHNRGNDRSLRISNTGEVRLVRAAVYNGVAEHSTPTDERAL